MGPPGLQGPPGAPGAPAFFPLGVRIYSYEVYGIEFKVHVLD